MQDIKRNEEDTICALATPVGGAIAVIRLSGAKAIEIAEEVFSHDIMEARGGTLHYGEIRSDDGSTIDDVVLSVYRKPHSYTGEDCVEISCHGSRYITREILLLLQAHGARQAEPGEYTRRAYLNGKMDLSQAEAVADVIASANRMSHDLAISQLKGHVRSALEELRERLLKLTSLLELELDFSEHEDLEFADRGELLTLANDIRTRLSRLADTYKAGKAIKEGIPVAIVGRPNVGKSTLLNCLLGEDRAIVSDIPGTTRDSIEDTADIGGLTFRFIDTAGLRHSNDQIERIGIERTHQAISRAAIVLWLADYIPSSEDTSEMEKECEGKKLICVLTKADLRQSPTPLAVLNNNHNDTEDGSMRYISISAMNGQGMENLEKALLKASEIPQLHEGDTIITSARQYSLLSEALSNIDRVIMGLTNDLSSDLIAEDLRLVLDNLADITGIDRIAPQAVLNNIFSHFCIGK